MKMIMKKFYLYKFYFIPFHFQSLRLCIVFRIIVGIEQHQAVAIQERKEYILKIVIVTHKNVDYLKALKR